jgi:hypothetical protein
MLTGRKLMRLGGIALVGGALALLAIMTSEIVSDAGPYQDAAQPANELHPAAWPADALTIADLGHSALLMDWHGVRVLSDPTLFNRVGLSVGRLLTIGPRRHSAPPLAPAQLQNLDVILITHAHMDHLDLPSLRILPKSAVVIACSGCGDLIRPLGFTDVRELRWGERTEVKGLSVTAMGAKHWGVRWPPIGRAYGYNSYVLEGGGARMLLACDSAFTPLFTSLASHPPDIAAFDRRLRSLDSPSRQSRAGLDDVPAERSALPGADPLGNIQAFQRTYGRTDAPLAGSGRTAGGQDRYQENRRCLDDATICSSRIRGSGALRARYGA